MAAEVTAPLTFQVVIDAASPRAIGEWWAGALGYIEQPPPPGFDTWEAALEAAGMDPEVMEDLAFAIVDPTGNDPRVFFQKVPEAKVVKNRVHLDLNVGPDAMDAKADELIADGATLEGRYDQPHGTWITLLDPEGNEFCVH